MRHVRMSVLAAGRDSAETFDRISDFARYPELTDAVCAVVVDPPEPDGTVVSEWSVYFRKGLLCWVERDTFDRATGTIAFRQITGDFAAFDGSWRIEQAPAGALVTFYATFDLGMPTLADLLDPVAASTLCANILLILQGLLGTVELIESGDAEPVEAARD